MANKQKSERFITEYANSKIEQIRNNELMQFEFKTEKISKIDRATRLRSRGLITADEAIKIILEA